MNANIDGKEIDKVPFMEYINTNTSYWQRRQLTYFSNLNALLEFLSPLLNILRHQLF